MSRYNIQQLLLITLHKLYEICFGKTKFPPFPRKYGDDVVSEIVSRAINDEKPFMLSRFGAVEIEAVWHYLGVTSSKHNILKYIKGMVPGWWWNEGNRRCMTDNAGFFPATDENMLRFGEIMIESMQEIDILTSWQNKEYFFKDYLHCKEYINYIQIDPFWATLPWTYSLKGKIVLVIHPFAKEIEYQYHTNRDKLFKNPKVLPEFTLITLQAVQSIGGNDNFHDWFEALDYMKNKISETNFDVCLLGCGAYGMPLAAYVKSLGKQAIHIGGSLQLLFGIRGARWENTNYGSQITHSDDRYTKLFNRYWIRPFSTSQVSNAEKVDNGCYW